MVLVQAWRAYASARLAAGAKDKPGDLRPIASGEAYRRLDGRVMMAHCRPQLQRIFAPGGQVGIAVSCGAEGMAHGTAAWWAENQDDPDAILLELDRTNAHNEVERTSLLSETLGEVPDAYA